MSEWLAVEAITRQRDKEMTAASIAKLSLRSQSGEQGISSQKPQANSTLERQGKSLSNEVYGDELNLAENNILIECTSIQVFHESSFDEDVSNAGSASAIGISSTQMEAEEKNDQVFHNSKFIADRLIKESSTISKLIFFLMQEINRDGLSLQHEAPSTLASITVVTTHPSSGSDDVEVNNQLSGKSERPPISVIHPNRPL